MSEKITIRDDAHLSEIGAVGTAPWFSVPPSGLVSEPMHQAKEMHSALTAIYNEAAEKAAKIRADDLISEKRRATLLIEHGEALRDKVEALRPKLGVVASGRDRMAADLERAGVSTPGPIGPLGLMIWQKYGDLDAMQLEIVYQDFCEQIGRHPNAQAIVEALETMPNFHRPNADGNIAISLQINRPWRRLSDDIVAKQQKLRGERANPELADVLGRVRDAHSDLTRTHKQVLDHVVESFDLARNDFIEVTARGD
ncbi:hypothetical protein E9232_001128 [Inquilinus ginsengisoli]|uniref:Uncharacterized protein n=1 Tax=Inquilinus ginsengisoli TaxID=363840 RepID=A0ABU1JJ28_9PROT|nr:hypothetical protein [Inquilinus ginsengisoli]MDR6288621.1 hypothetical protein [Inquilinus ginsengisoli]